MVFKNYAKNYKTENEIYYDKLSGFVFHSILFIIFIILVGLIYFYFSFGKNEKQIEKFVNSQTNAYCNETYFISKRTLIKKFATKINLEEFNKIWKHFENSKNSYDITLCDDGFDYCIRSLHPHLSNQCEKNIYLMKNKNKIYYGILTLFILTIITIILVIYNKKQSNIQEIVKEIIKSLEIKQKSGIRLVNIKDIRKEFENIDEKTWKRSLEIIEKEFDQIHVFHKKEGTLWQIN